MARGAWVLIQANLAYKRSLASACLALIVLHGLLWDMACTVTDVAPHEAIFADDCLASSEAVIALSRLGYFACIINPP